MFKPDTIVYNKYKIISRLAYGAFSVVYKVKDIENEEELCLKAEIHPAEYLEYHLLEHEFNIGNILADSIYSCHMYAYFPDQNNDAIIMEILGDSLSNFRRKRQFPPTLSMLIYITSQCLRALQTCHERSIVHADIKPSNFAIRFTEDDYNIVLFDYGLSILEGESSYVTQFRDQLKRNPRYLSLHTLETNQWNQEDDLWALLYSISDFWKDELPWDGRTTADLVSPIKTEIDNHSLLPPELGFLVDDISLGASVLAEKLEQLQQEFPRNIQEEILYITNPIDPGRKTKLVKYVYSEDSQKERKNQHSA